MKPLKVDNFPTIILENGTSSPVVESCKGNKTYCYEFDHDNNVEIARSIDGKESKIFNFEILKCISKVKGVCEDNEEIKK